MRHTPATASSAAIATKPEPDRSDRERPLTKRQELIWLEHELAPRTPSNVMVARFEVGAPIDEARFEDAFSALVLETEALRTVITASERGPSQRVRDELVYRPALVDLSSAADPDAALDTWLAVHATRPMDLGVRLFDAALVRLTADRHVVYLRQHHIITDAESHALLWRRLGELYDRRPGVATRPFAEYLERERAYRESPDHEEDARFWSDRLSSAPPPPTLYGRAPRERRGLVHREVVPLGSARTALLRKVARQGPLAAPSRGLARHAIHATALFALLARVSGQRKIAIGCPLANRRSKRLRSVVGIVMEQSPMICDVPIGDTFADLHARVRADVSAVLAHSRFSTHNPSQRRVYEATLNVHTTCYAPFAGVPVRASIAPAVAFAEEWPASITDGGQALALTAWEDGDDEVLAFDLNRDVFDAPLRRRVIAHYLRVLDALLADVSTPIGNVDLLTDEERAICLSPFPRPARLPSVVETILAQAQRTPDRAAVGFATRTLSYRELVARAGGIARALREAGVRRGDAVAIALDRSELLPAALIGTMAAGAAYVPLDPDHPIGRLERILEDARPRMLLTEPSIALEGLADGLIRVDASRAGEDELRVEEIDGSDLAYVIFTSGSTGRPKGVEITHHGLASFLAAFAHTPGMCADDRVIAMATPAFDIHTVELLLPLCVGAYAHVTDARANADGPRLARILSAVGATILQATPPTWRMLLDAGWRGDPRLTAFIGGEALPPDLAEALLAKTGTLWNLYGPTETTVWATAQRVMAPEIPAPVGRPVGHLAARVLDERGVPVPIGVEGEIHLSGRGVAPGYRNRPELTRELFVTDRAGHRLYRTGDRGRFREDGALVCLGRRDAQVKVRGHRVELGEIEAVLREHPAVADAAVVLAGEGERAHLAGHVSRAAGHAIEVSELRAFAAARLPAHMVPSRWQVLDALPIGPTGKVDRRALAASDAALASCVELEPRDDTEAALAALFAEALDVRRIGVEDDFFELGGHSLLAARLVERIRATLGVELPIGAIFEARTVAALAKRLHRGEHEPVPGCIALSRGSEVPLFAICGVQIYHPLAVRLGRAVYGVYLPIEEEVVRDARARRTTTLSVPSMARLYVDVIRAQQPRGPYAIGGLSFGGVLAYEAAQQLRAAGEEVGLIALFDSILPRALVRDPWPWLEARVRRLVRGESLRAPREHDDASVARFRERAFVSAMRRYTPRRYDGQVVLFRARESSFGEGWTFPRDGGFAGLAPRLSTIDVPGDHLSVLAAPHVDVLAEKLRPFLDRLG